MSKIEWLNSYQHETGCGIGDARRAWEEMYAHMAEDTELRDRAALASLQGMLAHSTRYRQRPEDSHLHWHAAMSREAFQIADAFIAAREPKEGEG